MLTAFLSSLPVFPPRGSSIQASARRPAAFARTSLFLGAVLAVAPALSFAGCASADDSARCAAPQQPTMSTLADLPTFKAIDGTDIMPSTFEGKIVLAVNVASACGYTRSGYDTMRVRSAVFTQAVDSNPSSRPCLTYLPIFPLSFTPFCGRRRSAKHFPTTSWW
jgi:Glutathione peroxidase